MLTLVAPPDVDGTKLWDSEPFLSYIYIYIFLSFPFVSLGYSSILAPLLFLLVSLSYHVRSFKTLERIISILAYEAPCFSSS